MFCLRYGVAEPFRKRFTKANLYKAYVNTNGVKYNEIKSEFTILKAGAKCYSRIPLIILHGEPIKRAANFKSLGQGSACL